VNDQAGILQQRIEVAPLLGTRQQSVKGVRGQQDEEQKARAEQSENAQHAGDHVIGQLLRAQRNRQRPQHQHQHPQQQRALVSAPDGGDAVLQRQQRVRMLRDIDHREIVLDEGGGQAAEGNRQQQRQRDGRRTRQRNPLCSVGVRTDQWQCALRQGDAQREDEGEGTEFRDHGCLIRITA
jgi:hypothetical protein